MSMIECSHLTMGYGSQVAVEDLSFTVDEGDYLCIVGPNGSGTSTLITGLLGRAPPLSGEILYHGVSPREIGYLPQQTPVQRDFPASVWEVVLSGCIGSSGWRPFYSSAQKDRAAEMLRRIGIQELRARSFRALSGGQRQRVPRGHGADGLPRPCLGAPGEQGATDGDPAGLFRRGRRIF